jgi:hypothetical protein
MVLAGTMFHASAFGASPAIDYPGMMRLTVDGLLASQLADGLFPYGFDFSADRPLEPDRMTPSNLIRQAGTVSALAAYYRYTREPRLREPLQRALTALERRSLPIGKSRLQYRIERTGVLSLPFARWKLLAALEHFGLLYESAGGGKVVSPDRDYGGALAGTVALTLLAELVYANASGDDRFAEARSAWLNGLLTLRIPGGGFRRTPASIDDSSFFNGEGWLALAVYADHHIDDARVAVELADLDQSMIGRYSRKPDRSFFHWGAMAAAQRFATTRDPRFLEFLRAQTDFFLGRFQQAQNPDGNHCAAMEGVAAIVAALGRAGEGDTDRALQIRNWLGQEAARLPQLQIQPGKTAIKLGGAAELRAPRLSQFPGAFFWNLYQPTIRVDAAQHCLSALVMIDRDRLDRP